MEKKVIGINVVVSIISANLLDIKREIDTFVANMLRRRNSVGRVADL